MTVVIVDDHPLMLAGLALALEREGFNVIGRAASSREAVELIDRLKPDAVVLDVLLPDGNGIQVCREVTRNVGASPIVLMLTTYTDALVAHAARNAGARGLVSKEAEPKELARLLHTLAASPMEAAINAEGWPSLTARERSVLRCIVLGRTYAESAHDLKIAEATVKDYSTRLFTKFNARDRYDLLDRLGSLAETLIDEI